MNKPPSVKPKLTINFKTFASPPSMQNNESYDSALTVIHDMLNADIMTSVDVIDFFFSYFNRHLEDLIRVDVLKAIIDEFETDIIVPQSSAKNIEHQDDVDNPPTSDRQD